MINHHQKRVNIHIKCPIFVVLFSIGFLLCYSQEKYYDFNLDEKFSHNPTVLRISINLKNHGRTRSIEEFLIYGIKISETIGLYKMHIYTQSYANEEFIFDTTLVLNGKQLMILRDFCGYIYNNEILKQYREEPIETYPAGWFITYTMEIAGEKYEFTDKKMLTHIAVLTLYLSVAQRCVC